METALGEHLPSSLEAVTVVRQAGRSASPEFQELALHLEEVIASLRGQGARMRFVDVPDTCVWFEAEMPEGGAITLVRGIRMPGLELRLPQAPGSADMVHHKLTAGGVRAASEIILDALAPTPAPRL